MQLEKRLDLQIGRGFTPLGPNEHPRDTADAFHESDASVDINESLSAELRHTLIVRSYLRITIRSKHHENRPPYKNEAGHTLH